jgi:hypothetical protein
MYCQEIEKYRGHATKATWQHVQLGNIPLHCCHVALPLRGGQHDYAKSYPEEGTAMTHTTDILARFGLSWGWQRVTPAEVVG